MKNELVRVSKLLEDVNCKRDSLKGEIDLYYSAKNGFMSSYGICSLFIFSLSIGSIILSYVLPSYIVGYLSLFINSISLSFLIYLISENTGNLRVMEKHRINDLKVKLNEYEKKSHLYDDEYKRIVETVMLGDDV